MSATIELRGWKGLAVLLVAVGIWGFTRAKAYRTLDTEAVETIRPWLVAAYIRNAMDETDGKPFDQMTAAEQAAYGEKVVAAGRVQVTSIKARGSGDDIVCRVEFLVDGKPPPDGKNVRYYALRYSALLGWSYNCETGPIAYYITMF